MTERKKYQILEVTVIPDLELDFLVGEVATAVFESITNRPLPTFLAVVITKSDEA